MPTTATSSVPVEKPLVEVRDAAHSGLEPEKKRNVTSYMGDGTGLSDTLPPKHAPAFSSSIPPAGVLLEYIEDNGR